MIDLHLINVALAGLGAGVAVVLLVAAAIYAVAVFGQRGRTSHGGQMTRTAPTADAAARTTEVSRTEVREPALR
jgi:hypothetical protein